ncbi:MAG: hypothetical protein M1839_001622 [Geoglossum umbratile]|nr:MAG: hypothetical protein M1839_001622 [Geoglossum umbratile]
MAPSYEDKKFYLKAPALEFKLNGPIKIGNIIKDMKYPQDPIAVLDPLPAIISGSSYGKGKKEHESHASVNISLSAKVYEVFGGQAEAKGSNTLRTVYEFDKIEALYLQTNPTAADARKICDSNKEVYGALNRGPVYIVTGLKIAKGLKYSNRHTAERQGGLSGQGHVTEDAAVEANMEGGRGGEEVETYTVKGDTILAYRLHIIKKEGFRWIGEPELDVKTFDPREGGFMNRDEKVQEVEVETGEVSQQDVIYFANEEEYGDVREVDIEDEEEAWSMLSIEG